MPQATIKIRAFPYYEEVENPVTGEKEKQERIARRGDTVELSDVDYQRAQRFDALASEEEQQQEAEDAQGDLDVSDPSSVEDASVEQLSAYIKAERPTVDETVAIAHDQPELAEKVKQAEYHATGGQPRSTLISELDDIINSAE